MADETTATDQGKLSRARGCLLGQVAGDALGSFVEFGRESDIRAEFPSGVRELRAGGYWGTLAGQPTDDSELALMLARSLVEQGRFDDDAVARAYGHWYASGPFDCGGTTRRALSVASRVAVDHAANARKVASRDSEANGALMRVSPLGVFGHGMPADALAALARRDADLTHPHPACQDASAVYCVAIARAVSAGEPADRVYAFALDWARQARVDADVLECLERAANAAPPAEFYRNMGWYRIAFENAFHRLLHATSLEAGVVETVMRGGDTDTNAAIAGALLGAVHGEGAIPAQWRESVLSCRPEAGRPGVRHPRPREFWPIDVVELADRLVARGAAIAC
jgi:ADP-ribosylglycohydrolase